MEPIKNVLSPEEAEALQNWIDRIENGEALQLQDLIMNCNNAYQFAKTHSAYLIDWEKQKQQSEDKLSKGILPPDTSANLYRAIIDATDEIMQKKLKLVRDAFEKKFGESIYNYLGPDGNAKKFLGIF
jgi:hypothetical protein